MTPEKTNLDDRRRFLQTGLAATSTAALLGAGPARADDPPAKDGEKAEVKLDPVIPTRKLGKTGVDVTMVNAGAVRGSSSERLMRFAFARGVRMFDTAKVYRTEPLFKEWFEQDASIRKQIFLVTKDSPRKPSDMLKMVDERLAALGTDYIDLFFVHAMGDGWKLDDAINFVKGKEFKETADAIRKSGKAKFIGFSSHHKDRAHIIKAAAEAGIVDAIMLMYSPWPEKDSDLNKALDVCWKKGVGLITMKQTAGQFFGDRNAGDILKKVVERVPVLKERNLTPFQGLLHAIWTDERISASCVSMRTLEHITLNTDAARRYKPLDVAQLEGLRDAARDHGPMLCADCDGRCGVAAKTGAELGVLTRLLTYHEHHGERAVAREQYAALAAEERDWSGADLEAARAACPNKLDFAKLLPEVDRLLA